MSAYNMQLTSAYYRPTLKHMFAYPCRQYDMPNSIEIC